MKKKNSRLIFLLIVFTSFFLFSFVSSLTWTGGDRTDTNVTTACSGATYLLANGTCASAPVGGDPTWQYNFTLATNTSYGQWWYNETLVISTDYNFSFTSTYNASYADWDYNTTLTFNPNSTQILSQNVTNFNQSVAEITATTTYLPQNVTLQSGTLDAGNITSLQFIEDGDIYNVSEVSGPNPLTVNITYFNVVDFNTVNVRVRYDAGSAHKVNLGIWNYVTLQWEDELAELTDMAEFDRFPVTIFDPQNHISEDGNVTLRFNHVQNGNPAHDLFIDYIVIVDGFSPFSTIYHDGLSGRDSITNHPWAASVAGLRNFTGNINFSRNIFIDGGLIIQGFNLTNYLYNQTNTQFNYNMTEADIFDYNTSIIGPWAYNFTLAEISTFNQTYHEFSYNMSVNGPFAYNFTLVTTMSNWTTNGTALSTLVSQVGIGTTNPVRALHIVGAGDTRILINNTGDDGGAGSGFFGVGSEGGFIQLTNSSGAINTMIRGYAVGGVTGFQTAIGNFGFGIKVPQGQLHLNISDVDVVPLAGADNLIIEEDGDSGITILSNSATGSGIINFGDKDDADNAFIKYLHQFRTMAFSVDGAEKFRLEIAEGVVNEGGADYDFRVESAVDTHSLFVQGSDGSVGIGIATPNAKLEVLGDAGSGANAPIALNVTGGIGGVDGPTGFDGGHIFLTSGKGAGASGSGGDGGSVNITTGAGGSAASVGGDGGDIFLTTGAGGSAPAPGNYGNIIMALNGGRVGIGTSSPTHTLNVVGTLNVTGGSPSTGGLFVNASGSVGIGKSTPFQLLNIFSPTNPQILIEESNAEFVRLGVEATGNDMVLGWDDSDEMHFGEFASRTDTSVTSQVIIRTLGYLTGGSCAEGKETIIWAEETLALNTATEGGLQWSFGNGATAQRGLTMACGGTITALSINCAVGSAAATGIVRIAINGVSAGPGCSVNAPNANHGSNVDSVCSIPYSTNDEVGFITTTSDAGDSNCRVTMWTQNT